MTETDKPKREKSKESKSEQNSNGTGLFEKASEVIGEIRFEKVSEMVKNLKNTSIKDLNVTETISNTTAATTQAFKETVDQLKDAGVEIKKFAYKTGGEVSNLVQESVGLVRREEFDKLERKVKKLEKQLKELSGPKIEKKKSASPTSKDLPSKKKS